MRFHVYYNPTDTPVAAMRRRPNPPVEIEDWEQAGLDEFLRDEIVVPAASGMVQYARHLDSRIARWPALGSDAITVVAHYLATMGGFLLSQDVLGAAKALNTIALGDTRVLPAELQSEIRRASSAWRQALARAIWTYLRSQIVDPANDEVIAQLRSAGALPPDVAHHPDEDLDVTESLNTFLGDALQRLSPGDLWMLATEAG